MDSNASSTPAIPRGPSFNPSLRVSELIEPISLKWKTSLLQEQVEPDDIPYILSLKPSKSPKAINYCWNLTKSGVYSVKTEYDLAMETEGLETPPVIEPSITGLQAKVWKLKTSKKIQHFIWQALSNCIPVCSLLSDRHCGTDRHCPRCDADEETRNHLLFECPPSVQTWALVNIPHAPGLFPCDSIYSNLDHVLWRTKDYAIPDSISAIVLWVLWYIWKARNDKVFNGKDVSPLETVQIAQAEAESWSAAQLVEQSHRDDFESAPLEPPPQPPGPRCKIDAS